MIERNGNRARARGAARSRIDEGTTGGAPARAASWILASALALAGCGGHEHGPDCDHGDGEAHATEPGDAGAHDAGSHDAGHVHVAPHGGHLVVAAPEFAHVELLFDEAGGELVAYLLGPHAETPLRSARESLRVHLAGDEPVVIELAARANPLSGETVGDTSEFRGAHEALRAGGMLRGRIEEVELRGRTFTDLEFELERAPAPGESNAGDGDA